MPSKHSPHFLLDTVSRKYWSEHPIFYWTVSMHTIRFFITDKKLTYLTIFYWCHLVHAARFFIRVRAASHYMILCLRRPAMDPHDAITDRTSCSVRPSAILSAAILTIGGYRRPS